jgi:glycosyltransferase involved in cell wall biosynthesis
MSSVVVAQFGARMHYAVPRIFHAAGSLEHLFTDFAAGAKLQRLHPLAAHVSGLRRMISRFPASIPADRITQFPSFTFAAAVLARVERSEPEHLRFWISAGRRFCRAISARGFGSATAVYGFNSAALEMLDAARRRGLRGIVEQTIAAKSVEARLMSEEAAAWPGWLRNAPPADVVREYAAREAAEWSAADTIVCGSEFVKASIAEAGGPADRCTVVPYGVDAPSIGAPRTRHTGPLNVLFCGAVSARKGVPYLLKAARALPSGRFRFRLVGPVSLPRSIRADLARRCDVVGAVPRPAMAEHYRWADVFVLPSICEGSATVCYEALAAGLPIITTPNSGSVVRDGVEGYVVPIRSAAAIMEKLELLAADPAQRDELAANALARSREFTVSRYAGRLLSATGFLQ